MNLRQTIIALVLAAGAFVAPARADLIVSPTSFVWAPTQNFWWGHINSSPTYYSTSLSGTTGDQQCEGFQTTYCNTTNLTYDVALSASSMTGAFDFSASQNRGFYNGYAQGQNALRFTSQYGFTFSLDGMLSVLGSSTGRLYAQVMNTDNESVVFLFNALETGLSFSGVTGAAGPGNYQLMWFTYIISGELESFSQASGNFNFAITESHVPAPGALALFGFGLLAISALRRRRVA